MYILNVSYIRTPAEVEAHKDTHNVWVKKYLEAGVLIAAGPKKSGLGGVLLAKSMDKSTLLNILAEDSYVTADVAEYQIIDFDCKVAEPGLEKLVGV